MKLPSGSRLYVGCGEDVREGFVGCDLRPLPTVQVVCRAWEVGQCCNDVQEIYTRHMLEHLTFAEVQATLLSWHDALMINGEVHIVVPNLDFHIDQWRRAEWSEENLSDQWSDASWSMAGFYGWQRECDPQSNNYTSSYWDVHKCGFNSKVMRFLLKRAGFSNIRIEIEEDCHLVARATKLVNKGERQVAPTIEGIRIDHQARYRLAAKYIPDNARVLDIACGVGYGSSLLSKCTRASEIIGMDINAEAIGYAQENFSANNVEFRQADALRAELPAEYFDVIVSFETVEHIEQDANFLKAVRNALSPDGRFICSTPNEEKMPFAPKDFPYHIRHYTPTELEQLLHIAGYEIEERFSQPDSNSDNVIRGWDGKFNIAVCRLGKLV
ncbi:MAG: methyltransferase domain-containing protein [Planctomycetota bacterium]